MPSPVLRAALGAVSLFVVCTTSPSKADACGACFTQPPVEGQPETPSLVLAHRMALSVSPVQTVLWDQLQYAGSPSEFAWVLPVKPGARIELASDAWFDALDAATRVQVLPRDNTCLPREAEASCTIGLGAGALMGCGDGGEAGEDGGFIVDPENPVDIVSHESAGPYEIVVLRSDVPEALPNWLAEHDFAVPEGISPLIDAYAADGFDFVALRLLPQVGVQQMRPVRVVQPGAVPVLPLRMVAAGTGARTAMTLFVIGEGRYETENFAKAEIDPSAVVWDFATQSSNYAELRDALFDKEDGSTWITTFARKEALFQALEDTATGEPRVIRSTNGWGHVTLGEAYVEQAFENGETSETACADRFATLTDARRVVDACAGETCGPVDSVNEIDISELECDPPIGSDRPLDDLAVALLGNHPRDVWVTRLEANLSRGALASDLVLAPAEQVEREGVIQPTRSTSSPCSEVSASVRLPRDARALSRAGVIGVMSILAVCLILRRKARKDKGDAR